MSTPDFVKFSRVAGTPAAALARLEGGVLPDFGLEYERFGALVPDDDPYMGGLDLAGDMVPCRSGAEAVALAKGRSAWAISFLVRAVPGHVDFYVFDVAEDSFAVAVGLDTSMVYYETDELDRGDWLRGLLTAMTAALGCEVCGYGRDGAYEGRYESLVPAVVLSRLRRGELFQIAHPHFHAIKTTLVAAEEMNDLLEHLPKGRFLQYRLAISGYHLLFTKP